MKIEKHALATEVKRVYAISDVHSNLPALKAVLSEIPEGSVIVCAGDIIGYYLEPNEVCDLLKSRSVLCVQGNHDKYVLGLLEYPASRENKYRIIANRKALSVENRKWLEGLPDAIYLNSVDVMGGSVSEPMLLVQHGSPRDVEEYVYPDTALDFLPEVSPRILVLGHTHHPMACQTGGGLVMNPGSVGQPRDRKLGASYAAIDMFSAHVEFYRAAYPIANYQCQLEEAGVVEEMVSILSRVQ